MVFIIDQLAKKRQRVCIYPVPFLALVLVLALNLNACGFQLRGAINLSSDMSPIYIEQNSLFDLARELKSLLSSNKIDIVQNAQQSKSQLILVSENKGRRVLSVDGSGQAREYLISYAVNFKIIIKPKKNIEEVADPVKQNPIFENSISVSRTWLFDPNAVLAVTNEAEILYNDMRREAARMILLKLNALSQNNEKSAISTQEKSTKLQ